MQSVKIGERRVMEYIVKREDTPKFLAEKNIYVLSTPRMIALMETNAKLLIDERINDPEYTSVGYHVDVYHKAPAPLGSKLLLIAEVIEVNGRRVKFRVQCLLRDKIIGEGIHERVIVSWRKFMEKTKSVT